MTITAVEAADSRPVLLRREKIERGLGIALLVGVTIWLIWNFLAGPVQFINVGLAGLRLGAIYALIALGYTLVYGIIELINFAHGDLFMLGSVFSAIVLVNWLGAGTGGAKNWAFMVLTLLIVMALCALLNVSAERVAYRRLRRAPKLAPLITAVGISFIFQWFGLVLNGSAPKSWPKVIPEGGIVLGPVTIEWSTILVTIVTVPLLLGLSYIVQRTRQGKAMRATAQDQDAARLMGINVDRIIVVAFALGAVLAAVAGVAQGLQNNNIDFRMGFLAGLKAFTAAVIGGIGNVEGAVLGGLVLGVTEAMATQYIPGQFGGGPWKDVWAFVLLILVLVFRPQGLLGAKEVDRA